MTVGGEILNSFMPDSRGGGVLPIMDYTGRLHPKGAPFSGWRYIKGRDFFRELKYRKGLGKLKIVIKE